MAVLITAYLVPGVILTDFWTAVILVVVLGLLNMVVKPILILLTLPINVLTLGLFTFVINGLIVLIASNIIIGFNVASFWYGLLFSIVLSFVNGFLNSLKQ